MSTDAPRRHGLPGEPSSREELDRMIRVNQAGEYGAKRIYAGQLAVLGNTSCGDVLRHMAEQEQEHLDAFNRMVRERRVRPTALMPIWHVAGFALGAATALLGEKAAMACTVAVESVINDHYGEQEEQLAQRGDEPELLSLVKRFRAEEMEHHDTAMERGAQQAPAYQLLHDVISLKTRLAIWLSTRI
jgi:3-demethoxyubiquinol 3-hydroxylase